MSVTASTILAGVAANKTIGYGWNALQKRVIVPLVDKRNREFISKLCEEMNCIDEESLSSLLDEICQDESKSEALFDAYRRVAMSASPMLGPRIIALVTASAICEDRICDGYEEQILDAAQNLTDQELISFQEFFDGHIRTSNDEPYGWTYELDAEISISLGFEEEFEIKLRGLGFISIDISISRITDQSRHLQAPEIENPRLTPSVRYKPVCGKLASIVAKAAPMEPNST